MDNNQIDDKNSKDTILIIEDDEAIIEILKIFFKENKFEVFTAFNGKQGLDLISRGDISLILCDIMMPVMDGYETLQNIRLLYNQLEMPIIMMTAKSKEEDIVKAFELGANDYITKPFNFRVLYSRVKTHLTLKNINDKFIKQNEQLKNLTTRLEKVLDNAINFVGFTQSLNYLNK
ncbi:MAG TPA: response regulator, partial [bacterium]|nr:response regulator [bacterium]